MPPPIARYRSIGASFGFHFLMRVRTMSSASRASPKTPPFIFFFCSRVPAFDVTHIDIFYFRSTVPGYPETEMRGKRDERA